MIGSEGAFRRRIEGRFDSENYHGHLLRMVSGSGVNPSRFHADFRPIQKYLRSPSQEAVAILAPIGGVLVNAVGVAETIHALTSVVGDVVMVRHGAEVRN